MRVLVTGATGLVGNNVVRRLLDRGETVRVLTRATSDPRPLAGLTVERTVGDVCDRRSIVEAMVGVDRVLHCAAQVLIGWHGLDSQRAVNVEGTRYVGQAAREAGVRMVHVSSVDALGVGSVTHPADEETPRVGKTPCPYVITKREAEEVIQELVADGLQATIVNPGFMLGPWDWKPSSGKMLLGVGQRFAPLAPSGGGSFCDVRDVADGILAAMERGQVGENYIMAGYNLSYLEAWRLFARIGGRRGPLKKMRLIPRFIAGRTGDLIGRVRGREPDINSAALAMSCLPNYYSSERARRELGYVNRPFEETVQDAWDWFVEHGYVRSKSA